jgi:redox-regulated HSP33 family molecular chaperone
MLKLGLAIHERDERTMREVFSEYFAEQLQSALALAVHDKKARVMLERIAKKNAPDPDPVFG